MPSIYGESFGLEYVCTELMPLFFLFCRMIKYFDDIGIQLSSFCSSFSEIRFGISEGVMYRYCKATSNGFAHVFSIHTHTAQVSRIFSVVRNRVLAILLLVAVTAGCFLVDGVYMTRGVPTAFMIAVEAMGFLNPMV